MNVGGQTPTGAAGQHTATAMDLEVVPGREVHLPDDMMYGLYPELAIMAGFDELADQLQNSRVVSQAIHSHPGLNIPMQHLYFDKIAEFTFNGFDIPANIAGQVFNRITGMRIIVEKRTRSHFTNELTLSLKNSSRIGDICDILWAESSARDLLTIAQSVPHDATFRRAACVCFG
ncbi:hypothetical protein HC928_16580 [bacterium]|nr:hypothetical protein [bacterium]